MQPRVAISLSEMSLDLQVGGSFNEAICTVVLYPDVERRIAVRLLAHRRRGESVQSYHKLRKIMREPI